MTNRIEANAAEAISSPSGSQDFRGPADVAITWSASGDRRSVRCVVTSQDPNGERTIQLDDDHGSAWFEIGTEPDSVEGELTLVLQAERASLKGDFSTGPSTAFRGEIANWPIGGDRASTHAHDGVVIRSLRPCDELFPFLWVRAPNTHGAATERFVRWPEPKPFPPPSPGADLVSCARAFAASASYLGDPTKAASAAADLLRVADAVFDGEVEDTDEVVRDILDAPPARYLRTTEAQELETQLWHTFAADALLGPSNTKGLALVLRAIRARAVLAHLADGAGDPTSIASAFVVLPESFALRPEVPFTPDAAGWVTVLGVGVLEVVEKSLDGYELGDIARTVNVMPFESRVDRRSETKTYERNDEERDSKHITDEEDRTLLRSADLDREIRDVLGGESICRDYTGITPKTGPAGFCVSLTGKWNGNDCFKERSRREAATFAQRITERAVKRLEESSVVARSRYLALSSVREETSRIDNRGRAERNVGIFRWLEKIYTLRLSDRGLRLLTELVIDAPATAFVDEVASTGARALVPPVSLEKLTPPIDGPTDIQATNYRSLCARYGLVDVLPPPRKAITVSTRFEGAGLERIGRLEIPDGYSATDGVVTYAMADGDVPVIGFVGAEALELVSKTSSAMVPTASKAMAASGCTDCDDPFTPPTPPKPATGTTKLASVSPAEGTIPVVFRSDSPSFDVAVDLSCTLDDFDDRLLAWQEETYRRLFEAYETRHATYFDRLRDRIDERTAHDRARVIERVLTRRGMKVLAAKAPDGGTPSLSRFFEAAFDWSAMAYRFDDWGTGSAEKPPCCFAGESNVDRGDASQLDAFLEAGSARVLLPIRPGYELAVLYYLSTGKRWGGCPPDIPIDEGAVSALSELLSDDDGARTGGPSWRVRVPTAITVLDDDQPIPSSGGNS